MRTNILFFIAISVFISGCVSLDTGLTPIPVSSKSIDIPHYDNGKPYAYWHFAKHKEPQLKLSSPETSTDSLLLRIWITNPVGYKGQPHALIEIKNDYKEWTGRMILMHVDFNRWNFTEKVTKTKIIELVPKSDWESVVDSLYALKIDKLPTDEKIPNYYTESNRYADNSTTFSFEYSTPTEYRFYQYGNIYRAPERFWQPKNVIAIFDLLEDEIGWDSKAREYFK
jgi:hypothetical protein